MVFENDPSFSMALSSDNGKATRWVESFASITSDDYSAGSHSLTRQLYFPHPDDGYHLLAPLFPTSLVHRVYHTLREHKFSEGVKEARKARGDKKLFAHGYYEYPDLAVQGFGGSKPQNVSQLNSERHGENWLLPSLPPVWQSESVKPLFGISTIFDRAYGNRREVRHLITTLATFLKSVRDYNNARIRKTRADLVDRLVDELLQFGYERAELPSGWSSDDACQLPQAEALWLDPGRAIDDEVFATLYQQGEWKDEVANRFARWLNARLREKGDLHMGDPEHAEWAGVLNEALRVMKEELDHE
jgi:CRISPR-associated protein Csy1